MIEQKGEQNLCDDSKILKRDEQVINSYRKSAGIKKKNGGQQKVVSLLYVTSSFLTVAILAIGITIVNNYDRIKSIENSINRMNLELYQEDGVDSNNTSIETQVITINSNVTAEETSEEITTEASSEESPITSAEEVLLPTITSGNPTYYIVEYGDTLSSISKKMYDSPAYVQQIMDANNLSENDKIYSGDTIIIPTINQ